MTDTLVICTVKSQQNAKHGVCMKTIKMVANGTMTDRKSRKVGERMDREKIIKGLEYAWEYIRERPNPTATPKAMAMDGIKKAIAMLKEQETKKPKTFTVIDLKTGEYPDLEAIALHEEWAQGLVYCDMEGFAIEEDGTLLLMDECDNSRYCPIGRFEVVWDEQEGR